VSRLLVKVCGMTSEADARLCARLGADLLGFIFHPRSLRCVEPALPASLNMPLILKVGVFVDQSLDETLALMEAGRLDLAQLHGGQDLAFCAALAKALSPQRVIKVVWPEKAGSQEAFQAGLDRFAPHCCLFLADAGQGGGGHGRTIDGEVLAKAAFPLPWLLAGGLGPATIGPMLSRFRQCGQKPAGLDLNSGVESAPGIKDETLLRAAFAAIDAAQNCEVTP